MLNESDYLFTEEDYDTFKPEYQGSIHSDIMKRRNAVKEKLLEIHKQLLPELIKHNYNLATHPDSRHTFSWDRPVPYNKGKVNWIGIRYGRLTDIEDLNVGLGFRDKADKLGFHKYTCFQVDVAEFGVEVGIFHAVPYDSVDRATMHERMSDENFVKGLIDVLNSIKGYGFVWTISPKGLGTPDDVEHTFNFDFEDVTKFPEFYEQYDTEGSYSSLMYRFPRWDKRVLKNNITSSCLDIFNILYPVYDYIKWKRKEGVK